MRLRSIESFRRWAARMAGLAAFRWANGLDDGEETETLSYMREQDAQVLDALDRWERTSPQEGAS